MSKLNQSDQIWTNSEQPVKFWLQDESFSVDLTNQLSEYMKVNITIVIDWHRDLRRFTSKASN